MSVNSCPCQGSWQLHWCHMISWCAKVFHCSCRSTSKHLEHWRNTVDMANSWTYLSNGNKNCVKVRQVHYCTLGLCWKVMILLCHVRHKYTGCEPFRITSGDAQSENLFFPAAPNFLDWPKLSIEYTTSLYWLCLKKEHLEILCGFYF
jgi:hypothetical protein